MLITHSRMDHEVFMFDVGHGDCVLVADDSDRGLLVDCGAWNPRGYFKVPRFIEDLSLGANECGLVISHYHWDHYSLFRWFRHPDALFSSIYFPDLPMFGPGRETAVAVMDFLKVAVFANFSHYRILPEIFAKTIRPVIFCKKGVIIREASLPLKVFWPDLHHKSLGSEEVKERAISVRKLIEPIMDYYEIPKPSEYGADYSMARFFEDLEREEIQYRVLSEQEKKGICDILGQVEGDFRDIANIFSIAFKTHYKRKSRFLFLGDLSSSILNRISIPGAKRYDCVKTAHHGTEFGRALDGMSVDFLLVSRNLKQKEVKKINDGYISKIQYEMLLSTEFLGDCHIC